MAILGTLITDAQRETIQALLQDRLDNKLDPSWRVTVDLRPDYGPYGGIAASYDLVVSVGQLTLPFDPSAFVYYRLEHISEKDRFSVDPLQFSAFIYEKCVKLLDMVIDDIVVAMMWTEAADSFQFAGTA